MRLFPPPQTRAAGFLPPRGEEEGGGDDAHKHSTHPAWGEPTATPPRPQGTAPAARRGGPERGPRFPGKSAPEKRLLSITGEKRKKSRTETFRQSRWHNPSAVSKATAKGGEAGRRGGASSPDTLSFAGAQPPTLRLGLSKQPRDAEAQFLPHCKSLKEFSLSTLTKKR